MVKAPYKPLGIDGDSPWLEVGEIYMLREDPSYGWFNINATGHRSVSGSTEEEVLNLLKCKAGPVFKPGRWWRR